MRNDFDVASLTANLAEDLSTSLILELTDDELMLVSGGAEELFA
jgi:bacteriocin-like protein